MNPRRLFNWLIVLTVAAGLLSVPFAAPAVAKTHHMAGSMHAMEGDTHAMVGDAMATDAMATDTVATDTMATDGDMHAMAGAMPCCPGEGKPANDCDSCPLMALCSLSIPIPVPSGVAGLAPALIAQAVFSFPDDLLIDGLGARPPDHPPRS